MSLKTDLQKVQTARDEMKTALEDKGVSVGDDITTYAAGIESISTGGSNEIEATSWICASWQCYGGENLTEQYGFNDEIVEQLKVGTVLCYDSQYNSGDKRSGMIVGKENGYRYGVNGRYWYTTLYYVSGTGITEFSFTYDMSGDGYHYGTDDPGDSGGGPKACFTADTLVATENGLVPISNIKVDDMVYSMNENNEIELKSIDKLIEHIPGYLYNIVLDNETIRTTFSHPFYVEGVGKVTADKLQVGYSLKDIEGNLHIIKGIGIVEEVEKVYEIRVKDNHTYFVGNTQILVYNEDSVL